MTSMNPKSTKKRCLITKDKYFKPQNVAIVTGAASGVGRATAVAVSVNDLTVVGTDVDEVRGRETVEIARELGDGSSFSPADLSNDEDIEKIVQRAAQIGTIKYLANIAGIQHINSIEDFPMEKYDLMQRIMVRAPFFLSKLCIPHMKKERGRDRGHRQHVFHPRPHRDQEQAGLQHHQIRPPGLDPVHRRRGGRKDPVIHA